MSLVATFARRGVSLPMILDDVLVNFDDKRARIAASVLSDFAKDGHQVLLFTCHEHVRRMFNDLGADVRRLPSRYGEEVDEEIEAVVVTEPVVEEIFEEPEVEEVVDRVAAALRVRLEVGEIPLGHREIILCLLELIAKAVDLRRLVRAGLRRLVVVDHVERGHASGGEQQDERRDTEDDRPRALLRRWGEQAVRRR